MKHTITVLQDDIDNGRPNTSVDCPLARATRRDLGVDAVCATGYGVLSVECAGKFLLPPEARDFIKKFDRGEQVAPFKFEIDTDNMDT